MRKNKDLKLIFAKNLKDKRKKQKLTQAELAKKIGVSPSFITEIENGRKAPSFTNIEKISNELNAPTWSFFIENENDFDINYSKKELNSFKLKTEINELIDIFFTTKN